MKPLLIHISHQVSKVWLIGTVRLYLLMALILGLSAGGYATSTDIEAFSTVTYDQDSHLYNSPVGSLDNCDLPIIAPSHKSVTIDSDPTKPQVLVPVLLEGKIKMESDPCEQEVFKKEPFGVTVTVVDKHPNQPDDKYQTAKPPVLNVYILLQLSSSMRPVAAQLKSSLKYFINNLPPGYDVRFVVGLFKAGLGQDYLLKRWAGGAIQTQDAYTSLLTTNPKPSPSDILQHCNDLKAQTDQDGKLAKGVRQCKMFEFLNDIEVADYHKYVEFIKEEYVPLTQNQAGVLFLSNNDVKPHQVVKGYDKGRAKRLISSLKPAYFFTAGVKVPRFEDVSAGLEIRLNKSPSLLESILGNQFYYRRPQFNNMRFGEYIGYYNVLLELSQLSPAHKTLLKDECIEYDHTEWESVVLSLDKLKDCVSPWVFTRGFFEGQASLMALQQAFLSIEHRRQRPPADIKKPYDEYSVVLLMTDAQGYDADNSYLPRKAPCPSSEHFVTVEYGRQVIKQPDDLINNPNGYPPRGPNGPFDQSNPPPNSDPAFNTPNDYTLPWQYKSGSSQGLRRGCTQADFLTGDFKPADIKIGNKSRYFWGLSSPKFIHKDRVKLYMLQFHNGSQPTTSIEIAAKSQFDDIVTALKTDGLDHDKSPDDFAFQFSKDFANQTVLIEPGIYRNKLEVQLNSALVDNASSIANQIKTELPQQDTQCVLQQLIIDFVDAQGTKLKTVTKSVSDYIAGQTLSAGKTLQLTNISGDKPVFETFSAHTSVDVHITEQRCCVSLALDSQTITDIIRSNSPSRCDSQNQYVYTYGLTNS